MKAACITRLCCSERKYNIIETIIYVFFCFFVKHNFCVKPYVPREPEGTQAIVGSMNMGYISDTARNRTHNLFRPKREPIPLGHSAGVIDTGLTSGLVEDIRGYTPYDHLQKLKKSVIRSITTSNKIKIGIGHYY